MSWEDARRILPEASLDWIKIIETGIYDYLKRIVLTDLKPPLIYKIREDRSKYQKLNQWVYEKISPYLEVLGRDFDADLKNTSAELRRRP